MFTSLIALLLALIASWGPAPAAPAAAVPVASQVSEPAAPSGSQPSPAAPAPVVDEPGEEWPAFEWESWPDCDAAAGITTECVQQQLPEETIGRALD